MTLTELRLRIDGMIAAHGGDVIVRATEGLNIVGVAYEPADDFPACIHINTTRK